MEIGWENLSCVTKNLHSQQGLLDSLPEQSKEPFIFHQLAGGDWWDMRGGGKKKTWLLKGGSVAL